jgi:hypothetical protein
MNVHPASVDSHFSGQDGCDRLRKLRIGLKRLDPVYEAVEVIRDDRGLAIVVHPLSL